ncbi:MAG: recombinase RecT [Candidatus Zipacnadales bacterium]
MITAQQITDSRSREDMLLAEQIANNINAHKGDDRAKLAIAKEIFALRLWPSLNQYVISSWESDDGRATLRWAPTFRGMLALCSRSPELAYVEPVLVLDGDEFSYRDGVVSHMYNPLDDRIATPENIRGGYVRIVYRDGRPARYHFVSRSKIAKNRSCARRDRVWVDWFQEMALKTLIRDAFARGALPLTAEMTAVAAAIGAEDEYLGNDPDRPSMNGYDARIAAAKSQEELEAVLEQILADKALPADVRSKLRKQCVARHEQLCTIPATEEEARKVLAEMNDPMEIAEYGKKLRKLGVDEAILQIARQRYLAVTSSSDEV